MGYTTDFSGSIAVEPPLTTAEVDYLNRFSRSRRMRCVQGPYYVDRGGFMGQDSGSDVLDYNAPPDGQPELWCKWVPSADGTAIEWNGVEKFYNGAEWMRYLIDHFVGSDPIANEVGADPRRPTFIGHVLNGEIEAVGEDPDDRWKLIVRDNRVYVARGAVCYAEPEGV